MAFFEMRGIRKSFGHTEVLKGVDLTLDRGQTLAIIGSSGSGKTTMLRCINFLEVPDQGSIFLGGEQLLDAGEKKCAVCVCGSDWCSRISICFRNIRYSGISASRRR